MSIPAERGSKRQGNAISVPGSKRRHIDRGVEKYLIKFEGEASKITDPTKETNFLLYYPLSKEVEIEFGERSQFFTGLQSVYIMSRNTQFLYEDPEFIKTRTLYQTTNRRNLNEFFESKFWKSLKAQGFKSIICTSIIDQSVQTLKYDVFYIKFEIFIAGQERCTITMTFNEVTNKPNMNIFEQTRRLKDEIFEIDLNRDFFFPGPRVQALEHMNIELKKLEQYQRYVAFTGILYPNLGADSLYLPPELLQNYILPHFQSKD